MKSIVGDLILGNIKIKSWSLYLRMNNIEKIAEYLLNELREVKIKGIHPEKLVGKIEAYIEIIEYIDKEFGTNYESKIKIEKISFIDES